MKKLVRVLVAIVSSALCASAMASAYSNAVLSNNPIFYLRFNETLGTTAADASGNSHDGTYVGGVTLGASAGFAGLGTAASFDGSDDRVRVTDSAAFDLGTGDYSIEFWFQTGSTARGDIFTYKGGGGDYGIHNASQAGQTLSTYHNAFTTQSATFNLNQWHHAVLVRSGGSEQYYVNGAASGAAAANGQSLNIANDILIGANHSGDPSNPAIPYTGQLDEVAYYGTALTATQVFNHYASAASNSIGINFVGGNGGGEGQTRSLTNANGPAGVVPQINWNNATGSTNTVNNLVADTGLVTNASITFNPGGSGGTWSTGNGSGDADAILMNGYVDSFVNETSTYTVSNIPYLQYNVLVYTDSDAADGRDEVFTLNGGPGIYVSDDSLWTGSFVRATATTQDGAGAQGNYVMFENVTGSSFTLNGTSLNFRNFVNGIQIVQVPEPSSLVLAGLGLLGILRMARRGRNSKANTLLVAALVLCCSIGSVDAASIGFNFIGGGGSGSPGTVAANETAGAPGYVQGNWNNLANDWSGSGGAVPVPVLDSNGATVSFPAITIDPGSGAGIWFDSNTVWGNGGPNTTGNDHLMRGYLDDNGDGSTQPFIQLYNIPYATYDLVVYFDGDGGEGAALGPYWVETATSNPYAGGGTLLTPKIYALGTATFNGTFTQVPLTATSAGTASKGNYIVFQGLTASDINIRATQENGSRAPINGFQIVPEPSSLVLAGMSLLGMFAAARRRRHAR